MAFKNTILSVFLSTLFVLQTATAQTVNATSVDYSISAYGVKGTGCPSGTVSASLIGGGKDISLKYSSFSAQDGPAASPSDNRKNCQLTLTIQAPAGYQFGFDKFKYDGSYSVAQNVKASYQTYYYFQSQISQVTGGQTLVGPAKDACSFADTYSGVIWSGCGGSSIVNIDTSVIIDNSANKAGSGAIAVTSTPSVSNFVWRTC